MTDKELETHFTQIVATERKITHDVLVHINLIEDRKIHLKRGFSSLYDYLIIRHGYSKSSAGRRIEGARAIRVVPEVAEKLKSGDTNLSKVAKAQSMIRKQEKATGCKVGKEQRAEILKQTDNKTCEEAEKTLFELLPEAAEVIQESLRMTGINTHRLSTDIPQELLENLLRMAELLSHAKPEASKAELLLEATEFYLDENDPLRIERKKSVSDQLTPKRKQEIKKRDNDECQWQDELTKRKCQSKYRIQVDHIIPRAHGGSDKSENLRCLCQQHNLLHAEQTLGKRKANEWRNATSSSQPRS